MTTRGWASCALLLLAGGAGAGVPAPAARTFELDLKADAVAVHPLVDCKNVMVSVSGPTGSVASRTFPCGAEAVLPLRERGLRGDGAYTYEVRLVPADGEAAVESGYFRVEGGAVLRTDVIGGGGAPPADATRDASPPVRAPGPAPEDVPFNDDVIVKGRICAGANCASGETFDFETLRLKQLLPGIKFVDTGTTAGARDWQIFINTFFSTVDRFAISDLDSGRTPFTLRGNAPSNAFYLDPAGKVGFGTATPAVALHAVQPSLPALRLDQTGGGGSTPQSWSMSVGYAGAFAINDLTHGSLPFFVHPASASNSLAIYTNGDVGVGTTFPTSSLHVVRSDGTAKLLVQEGNPAPTPRVLAELKNFGPVTLRLQNDSAGNFWALGNNGLQNFFVTNQTSTGLALSLEADGDLTILGSLSQSSDRDSKDGLQDVDRRAVLVKLAELPISTWHRKTDDADVRHLGPMAQDFAAAFGLGDDERRIAPLDVSGVALAAIQALDEQVKALERTNAELLERLERLEAAAGPR